MRRGAVLRLLPGVEQSVTIPVINVSLISEYEQAEAIVGTGDADLIAMARTILYLSALALACRRAPGRAGEGA